MFTSKPLIDALKTLKTLAVVPVAIGVVRSELLAMRQDPDEPFAVRVQGKAETCEFKTAFNDICTGCNAAFNGTVYYTDEVIRDVLLNGVADNEIRCDTLNTDGIQMSQSPT